MANAVVVNIAAEDMRHVMETLMQTQEGEEDEITWRRWRRECLVWTLV